MNCRICDSADLIEFTAREHLVGTGERFRYAECRSCGCLQIVDVPANLARYYAAPYGTLRSSLIKQAVRTAAYRVAYSGSALGRLVGLAFPFANYGVLATLRKFAVRRDAAVLDVGSGAGRFLHGLRALGFTGQLVGIDPFLAESSINVNGVALHRQSIAEVEGTFDVITLIHTLEHMPDQRQALSHVGRLLSRGGICVVAIPVAGGWAWERYRENWVQLDPPRHIVLHTPRSLELLAGSLGLSIRGVVWDSTSLQVWGSELARRERPLAPWFRAFLRAAWRIPMDAAVAARLNRVGRGDQATFVLTQRSL